MWIDKLMVGMWKVCFVSNWIEIWIENMKVDEIEIMLMLRYGDFSLKLRLESGWNCNCDCNWDWDCGWLNWNDDLVVNWIFDGLCLIIDCVIVDWLCLAW